MDAGMAIWIIWVTVSAYRESRVARVALDGGSWLTPGGCGFGSPVGKGVVDAWGAGMVVEGVEVVVEGVEVVVEGVEAGLGAGWYTLAGARRGAEDGSSFGSQEPWAEPLYARVPSAAMAIPRTNRLAFGASPTHTRNTYTPA